MECLFKATFQNSQWIIMIIGNTSFRLSKKAWEHEEDWTDEVEEELSKLKEGFRCSWMAKRKQSFMSDLLTNNESNAFANSMDEINKSENIQLTDDYYTVDEIDVDKKLQAYRVFEISNRKYAYLKEMFVKLQENIKKKENKGSSLLFYDDPYLEKKLFVHLFSYGTGEYNSTYCKIIKFSHYSNWDFFVAHWQV